MSGIMDGKGRRGRPNFEGADKSHQGMVQKRSAQLDYICTRPKIVERNDESCVGHLVLGQPMDHDDDDEAQFYNSIIIVIC